MHQQLSLRVEEPPLVICWLSNVDRIKSDLGYNRNEHVIIWDQIDCAHNDPGILSVHSPALGTGTGARNADPNVFQFGC